jgi:hypothetical protein
MVYINGQGQTKIFVRPRPSGFDADAQAFLTAAAITDDTQKSAVNTLVRDLKRFGLWTKIKAFYPFVGGTAASHKLNLIDPRDTDTAYRLTFSGGWTHTSMGAQCNGTNATSNTYLSLRTVFGATSYEHCLGIYINDNPTARISYRSDIWASDGSAVSTPNINQVTAGGTTHIVDITTNWWSWIFTPKDVRGHTEFKRSHQGYVTAFINGSEYPDWRNTTSSPYYNPLSTVRIGSSESMSKYACAYIASAISTLESQLMYIAVQRYQSALGRQYSTPIYASTPAVSYGTQSAPDLVTSNLKLNLDSSNVTEPQDVIMRLPWANQPGPYFLKNDVWPDASGNGNHGVFNRSDNDNRSSKYQKDDLLIPDVRFHDATINKVYGSSYDFLETPYFGPNNGTFTFGGWFKTTSIYNGFMIARGKDGMGEGWNMTLTGSPGGKVGVSVVAGYSQINFAGTTTLQSDVWYNIYGVWKPGSYVKIYINGNLDANLPTTATTLRTSTAGWGINRVHGSNYFAKSIVGAMHVYDRELTAAEILQNFEATRRKYNI